MVPSARRAGPEANHEGSRTALGRIGENEKHRGNDRRQPPLSSISHPMQPAKRSPEPYGRVRVSRMPPILESAVYVRRREWHSYIDDTGHLHLCWRIVELIEQ